jgi:hypothetical protein
VLVATCQPAKKRGKRDTCGWTTAFVLPASAFPLQLPLPSETHVHFGGRAASRIRLVGAAPRLLFPRSSSLLLSATSRRVSAPHPSGIPIVTPPHRILGSTASSRDGDPSLRRRSSRLMVAAAPRQRPTEAQPLAVPRSEGPHVQRREKRDKQARVRSRLRAEHLGRATPLLLQSIVSWMVLSTRQHHALISTAERCHG